MSSGFITEAEIQQKRKVRQEQWEKVRKPEEPIQAPEDPVDTRSLYDRLKEQKDRKQEEFEESHKLKNLVKTLDDEEVEFLDYVDQVRSEEERKKRLEEAKELDDFRTAVSQLREQEIEKVIHQEIGIGVPEKSTKPKPNSASQNIPSIGTLGKTSQTKLLAGLVKRKSDAGNGVPLSQKKPKVEDSDSGSKSESKYPAESSGGSGLIQSVPGKGSLRCIGVLPGLGTYSDSSDSSDDEGPKSGSCNKSNPNDKFITDLAGRTLQIIRSEEVSNK